MRAIFCVLLCLAFTGCTSGNSLEAAFSDAQMEVRQNLDEAVKLDRADDYLSAAAKYDSVLQMQLTERQRKAVQGTLNDMYDRLCRAAARGDSEAKRLLDQIRGNAHRNW